ncbi:N-terminal kinase-like protein isoform X1 [Oscarella lobularis]|uniref:N-terminal kinase-like protein isoform X1 n=1 Tax=Oscarella lobularis TaxID=121494 RepID=UPI003313747F
MGQGQGKDLSYEIEDKYECLIGKTVWSVHKGKRKSDNLAVTLFVFEGSEGREQEQMKAAKRAYVRLKTFRHPNVIKFIDGMETETTLTVATEPVTPLEEFLRQKDGKNELEISWGLHQISKGLTFLSEDCSLVHGNICLSSVFVDQRRPQTRRGVWPDFYLLNPGLKPGVRRNRRH